MHTVTSWSAESFSPAVFIAAMDLVCTGLMTKAVPSANAGVYERD